MRALGLDFETTGFDTANDRVTEVGIILWDVELKRSLLIESTFLNDDGIRAKCTPETNAMMERVSGVTPAMLEEFGKNPKEVFELVDQLCIKHKVNYIVAHNGENYDKPLLMAELSRHDATAPFLRSLPWIDTRTDLPHTVEPDSRKLKHLALDAGFINPMPHRAVFDVATMLRILSTFDFSSVVTYSKIPFVTVQAIVAYEDRQKAKDKRYSWEKIGEKTYPKKWVKQVKEDQLAKEQAECPFKVVVIQ